MNIGINSGEDRFSEDTSRELADMFLNDEKTESEKYNNGVGKTDESISRIAEESPKVLMKTNDIKTHSYDGGYGSVLGVVLVIISISFILAALFIRMLI